MFTEIRQIDDSSGAQLLDDTCDLLTVMLRRTRTDVINEQM